MDLQPDAVPEPEVEPVCQPFALGARALGRVAGVLDHRSGDAVQITAGDPRSRGGAGRLERLADDVAQARHLVTDRAVDERPRHVRPAAAGLVARPQVDLDRQVRRQRPGPGIVAAPARQRGHDHDVPRSGSPRRGAGLADRRPHLLRRQRQPSPSRAAPRISASPAAMPASAARWARRIPSSSAGLFDAPPRLHRVRVHRDADARGAQPIGDRHRRVARYDNLRQAPLRDRAHHRLQIGALECEPLLHKLEEAEILGEQQLRRGQGLQDPVSLERAGEDERPSVVGDEQERIHDRERHLVPQRSRADRVAVEQDRAHVSSRSSPRRTPVISGTRRIASSVPAMYGSGVPPASWWMTSRSCGVAKTTWVETT